MTESPGTNWWMKLEKRLSFHVPSMITHSLQTITFTVIGDENETKGELWQGVPQGSPVSPTLFNILMGTLAESVMQEEVMTIMEKNNLLLLLL